MEEQGELTGFMRKGENPVKSAESDGGSSEDPEVGVLTAIMQY